MKSGQRKVLVVEDDREIRELVVELLAGAGIESDAVDDGKAGLEAALSGSYDLVILDIKLPGMNGNDVCRELKTARPQLPVMILSSLGDEIDRVLGLELGADDYVVKPFSHRELVARARARLRTALKAPPETSVHVIGALRIDPHRRVVSMNGEPVDLTAKEFDVVLLLASEPGRPFTKEELLREVWGVTAGDYEDSVTSLISRVRRKIEVDPTNPVYLLTARGVGYRLAEPHELSNSPKLEE